MTTEQKNELNDIISELNKIIKDMESISKGVRNDFKNIGNEKCANCIDLVISNYKTVKSKLKSIDTDS